MKEHDCNLGKVLQVNYGTIRFPRSLYLSASFSYSLFEPVEFESKRRERLVSELVMSRCNARLVAQYYCFT